MKQLIPFILSILSLSSFATDHLASSPEEAVVLLNKAIAGDRIILKDGVYKDAVLEFANTNGTKEKPVWFMAQTPGKVSFEGNSTLAFGGNYIIVSGFVWRKGGKELQERSVISYKAGKQEAMHCTVEDCLIDEYNNSDLSVDNKWVSLYGQYNTFTRCLLFGKNTLGATLTVWLQQGVPARHLISYNEFVDRGNAPNADNGLESIRIGDSKTSFTAAHCIVAFNRFQHCDGEIEIISNKSCHNSYLHNVFERSDGGLTLRHGNDCLVDGNLFWADISQARAGGVRIIGEGHVVINNCFDGLRGASQPFWAPITVVNGLENTPMNGYFQVRRAVISNNVFLDCLLPVIRMGAFSKRPGMTVAPDTVTVTNNMVIDKRGNPGNMYESSTAPGHLTLQNNKVWRRRLVKEEGFEWFDYASYTATEGVIKAAINEKAVIHTTAGADWIDPAIAAAIQESKYAGATYGRSGPSWWHSAKPE